MKKAFSARHHYDPKQPRQLFLEDVPEWARISFINGILSSLVYVDRDERYTNEDGRPLGAKDLFEKIHLVMREEPGGDYWDSWTCVGMLESKLKQMPWYHFLDFVELVAAELQKVHQYHWDDDAWMGKFGFYAYRDAVNGWFENDAIGWRLSKDGELSRPMPPGLEKRLDDVDASLKTAGFGPAREHYGKALTYATRPPLDPENAIKEVVSAVESVALTLFPGTNTLGGAIKKMESSGFLPGGLASVLERFWGYTSEAPAVRHGRPTLSKLSIEDADLALHIGAAMLRYVVLHHEGRN